MMTNENCSVEISIIIPAYNAEKYIQQTLKSVLKQSFQNYEILIVNDGSTDNTLNKIEATYDERIQIISQPNSGVSAARNKGIEIARGRFIYFLDADDILSPDALRRCICLFRKQEDVIAVYGEATTFSDENEIVSPKNKNVIFAHRPEGNILSKIIRSNCVSCGSSIMIRADLLKKTKLFPTSLRLGEDWALWAELSTLGLFSYLPMPPISFYRQHTESAARTLAPKKDSMVATVDYIYSLNGIKKAFPALKLEKYRKIAEASSCCYSAQEFLKNENWSEASLLYLSALKKEPLNLRTWILFACARLKVLPTFIRGRLK